MKFGIYSITHIATQSTYFGMTRESKLHLCNSKFGYQPIRFYEHLCALRRGDHYNADLLATWTGDVNDYRFNVVEIVQGTKKDALTREKVHMRSCKRVLNHAGIHPKGWTAATAHMCRTVMAMAAQGWTGKEIASRTGLSTGSVSLIKNRNGAPARKYLKETA